MLIAKDSALRCVPTRTETRQILYLDGIRYSLETLDLAFTRLSDSLEVIATKPLPPGELGRCIVGAMSDAWVVVDSGHRLRELVQQLPGLKQSLPPVQVFLRNTRELEELRHFYQHFRKEIHNFVERKMALWGTLSWARMNPDSGLPESHTIVPGTFFHDIQASSCGFDSRHWKFTDRILLSAGPKSIDLAVVYDRVVNFVGWFEKECRRLWEDAERHAADTLKPVKKEDVSGVQRRDHKGGAPP